VAEDDDEPFDDKMRRLIVMLRQQEAEGVRLDAAISSGLRVLGYA
jgi:type I restriction enzyme M protein